MKTTGFPRIRFGSRVRMVRMAVIGLLALEIATNEASAGPCNSGSSPRLACNGLEQTPDYKGLNSTQKGTVTEDQLNGPWIETIKRIKQCSAGQLLTLPIINLDEFDSSDESNNLSLSGPSLIRVPEDDLAQSLCGPTASQCYYVYYGNHEGEWIRLSFATNLSGPWIAYRPGPTAGTGRGVLYRRDLEPGATGGNYARYCADHIASPNVQIRTDLNININLNDGPQEVDCNVGESCYVMYFHCKWLTGGGDQVTFAAVSDDGKKFFHYDDAHAGNPYASLAQISPGGPNSSLNGRWLHVALRPNNNAPITMTSDATATNAGLSDDNWIERGCEDRQNKTLCSDNGSNHLTSPSSNSKIHHVGITARGRYLYVFFHRKEYSTDQPMHLRIAQIDMHNTFATWDWKSVTQSPFGTRKTFPVMAPVTSYERIQNCGQSGEGGPPNSGGACDVRDPNIFNDRDGRTYLVYAYAYEKGLAIAEIKWQGDAIRPETTYGNASTAYASCTDEDTIVTLDAGGNASIIVADVNDGSSGCGITLSLDQTAFTCADVGANTVTLTATDSEGFSTCEATVTVQDNNDSDSDGVSNCNDLCPGFDDSADCNNNGLADCAEISLGGLIGTYYPNIDFTGTPTVRLDPVIDFDWGNGEPFNNFGVDNFSIRWTGYLRSGSAGTYTFTTRTDDGVRLWVDGQLLIDDWDDTCPSR